MLDENAVTALHLMKRTANRTGLQSSPKPSRTFDEGKSEDGTRIRSEGQHRGTYYDAKLPKASDYVVSDKTTTEEVERKEETTLHVSRREGTVQKEIVEKITYLFELRDQFHALLKDLAFAFVLLMAYERNLIKTPPWTGVLREKDLRGLLGPFLGNQINSRIHESLIRLTTYIDTHEPRSFRFFTLVRDIDGETRLKRDLAKLLQEMLELLK